MYHLMNTHWIICILSWARRILLSGEAATLLFYVRFNRQSCGLSAPATGVLYNKIATAATISTIFEECSAFCVMDCDRTVERAIAV